MCLCHSLGFCTKFFSGVQDLFFLFFYFAVPNFAPSPPYYMLSLCDANHWRLGLFLKIHICVILQGLPHWAAPPAPSTPSSPVHPQAPPPPLPLHPSHHPIKQEQEAGTGAPAPSFGTSETPYPEVQAFYTYWVAFATRKRFGYKDKYNPSSAESRCPPYARRPHDEGGCGVLFLHRSSTPCGGGCLAYLWVPWV